VKRELSTIKSGKGLRSGKNGASTAMVSTSLPFRVRILGSRRMILSLSSNPRGEVLTVEDQIVPSTLPIDPHLKQDVGQLYLLKIFLLKPFESPKLITQ
jgi:hypothetical protein